MIDLVVHNAVVLVFKYTIYYSNVVQSEECVIIILLQAYLIPITEQKSFTLKETEVSARWVAVHIGKNYASYCPRRHIEFAEIHPYHASG